MDDAERIPIDIGYEVAAVGLAQTDPRATVQEDGSITIDISPARPCAPEPTTDAEIVVCASTEGEAPVPPPPEPLLMDQVKEELTVKVGPLEISPSGLRVRF